MEFVFFFFQVLLTALKMKKSGNDIAECRTEHYFGEQKIYVYLKAKEYRIFSACNDRPPEECRLGQRCSKKFNHGHHTEEEQYIRVDLTEDIMRVRDRQLFPGPHKDKTNNDYQYSVFKKEEDIEQNKTTEEIDRNFVDSEREKIANGVKHLTLDMSAHGAINKRIIGIPNGKEKSSVVKSLLHIPMSDRKFFNLKSFYIHSDSCCGGFYDECGKNLFQEVQEKLKQSNEKAPKCFISLVKPQYVLCSVEVGNIVWKTGTKRIPLKKEWLDDKKRPEKITIDLEELENNKDKYFNYYMVEKDKIWKVPHELVYNRVALLENKYTEYIEEKGDVKKTWDEKVNKLKQAGKIREIPKEVIDYTYDLVKSGESIEKAIEDVRKPSWWERFKNLFSCKNSCKCCLKEERESQIEFS